MTSAAVEGARDGAGAAAAVVVGLSNCGGAGIFSSFVTGRGTRGAAVNTSSSSSGGCSAIGTE